MSKFEMVFNIIFYVGFFVMWLLDRSELNNQIRCNKEEHMRIQMLILRCLNEDAPEASEDGE